MREKKKSLEDVDFLVAVEHDFAGVAVAAEHVANPLLLPWSQLDFALSVAVERGGAAQVVCHFLAHLGNVFRLYLIEDVREADGHAHLPNGVEVRARILEQGVGHDTLAHGPAYRRAQVDLVAHALVLAGALCDVAHGPVIRYLLEIEVFFHMVIFRYRAVAALVFLFLVVGANGVDCFVDYGCKDTLFFRKTEIITEFLINCRFFAF